MGQHITNESRPGDTDNQLLQKIADSGASAPADSAAIVAAITGGDATLTAAVQAGDAALVTAVNLGTVAITGGDAALVTAVNLGTVATQTNRTVGGLTSLVELDLTVTAELYAAGDSVGGKLTLANALRVASGTAILDSIHVLDRSNSKAGLAILIFSADPGAATITDGAAFVASTDDVKVVAIVPLAATDYTTVNAKAYATLKTLGIVVKASAASTSLFAAIVCVGAPTFVSTTDVHVKFGFLQD